MSDDKPEETHANNCQSHYGDVVKGGRLPCNCDPAPTGSETAEEIVETYSDQGLSGCPLDAGCDAVYCDHDLEIVVSRALAAGEEERKRLMDKYVEFRDRAAEIVQQRDRLLEALRLIRDRSAERTSQDRLAREVYGCAHAALAEDPK